MRILESIAKEVGTAVVLAVAWVAWLAAVCWLADIAGMP